MTVRRLIAFACLFLYICMCASAQMQILPKEVIENIATPRLSSDSSALEFDTKHIKAEPMCEDDPCKIFRYRFRNVTKGAIEIKRVTSTCSCATASASAATVAPGEYAFINVSYNPKGHPGSFERRIFVYTQEGNDPAAVLKLSVQVSDGKDLSGEWPVQKGKIRLRRDKISFAKGERAVENLRFVNTSDAPLKLESESLIQPKCLTFKVEPLVVQPGEEGVISIGYDPSLSKGMSNLKLILKGLGVPPSKSSINIELK